MSQNGPRVGRGDGRARPPWIPCPVPLTATFVFAGPNKPTGAGPTPCCARFYLFVPQINPTSRPFGRFHRTRVSTKRCSVCGSPDRSTDRRPTDHTATAVLFHPPIDRDSSSACEPLLVQLCVLYVVYGEKIPSSVRFQTWFLFIYIYIYKTRYPPESYRCLLPVFNVSFTAIRSVWNSKIANLFNRTMYV
jgi:hypothetical protein